MSILTGYFWQHCVYFCAITGPTWVVWSLFLAKGADKHQSDQVVHYLFFFYVFRVCRPFEIKRFMGRCAPFDLNRILFTFVVVRFLGSSCVWERLLLLLCVLTYLSGVAISLHCIFCGGPLSITTIWCCVSSLYFDEQAIIEPCNTSVDLTLHCEQHLVNGGELSWNTWRQRQLLRNFDSCNAVKNRFLKRPAWRVNTLCWKCSSRHCY